ncbi:MAG: translation initiation factor IF-2 [Acidobacteriota bacterium]
MDKVRVYELARDLGITSPETIQLLKRKLEIRVKSASSTVEEDVAIKLKRLIRLEGTRARTVETAEQEPAKSQEERARTAAKRRADRARLAILKELEEEEREAQKRQEEQRQRELEEAERRAAEVAREEAERKAAEEAAARAEAERQVAEVEAEPEPVAEEAPAAESLAEAIGEEVPAPATPRAPDLLAKPVPPPIEAPAPAAAAASATPSPPPTPAEPSAPAPPAAEAGAGEGSRPAPARPGFVPGPTSTYIRPRQPAPSRPGTMKPVPPPPRPAAPIKTVTRRRAEAKKPKPKAQRRQARTAAAAAAAEAKEQALPQPKVARQPQVELPKVFRKVSLTEGVTVKELAEKMEVKHKDLIKSLMSRGVLATINQTLDTDLAKEVARQFGCEAEILSFEEDVVREEAVEERPQDLVERAPVVTVMGHVDHGKTSLLDAIRQTKVVEAEAGGITQHIGAYKVDINQRSIVFLDTPGHEAFTMMRARGARVTDLVVLVVAADDGVMPQTIEAIDHARAAGVPLMVAINKIDKPDANAERVRKQLADIGLMPEDWGGSTVFCEVSAKKRQGLDLLLEMILLVSDLGELKANPKRTAMGTVLDAQIDRGKGPVAHVLVQNGSVSVGDSFIAGAVYGKVRAMFDDLGHKVKRVGPATPVEVLGLTSLPQAGDQFQVVIDSFKARQIGEFRQQKLREQQLARSARLTLDQLHQQVEEGTVKELPIVLKADVQGSVEVLTHTLTKLSSGKVKVKIIHAGAGAVSDTDVLLASASNAVIVGFNVRPQKTAKELAEKESIDVRLYTVIYNMTDEIKKAMEGLLEPTFKEVTVGRAEVRDTFRVPRVGTVAGCYVVEGKVLRGADIRLLRDNVVIHEGKIASLRRFKEDVTEVKQGFECGIGLAGYGDIKMGDAIEVFSLEKVQETAVQ